MTIERFLATLPFQQASDREHMRAGLALAGLPAEAPRSGRPLICSEGGEPRRTANMPAPAASAHERPAQRPDRPPGGGAAPQPVRGRAADRRGRGPGRERWRLRHGRRARDRRAGQRPSADAEAQADPAAGRRPGTRSTSTPCRRAAGSATPSSTRSGSAKTGVLAAMLHWTVGLAGRDARFRAQLGRQPPPPRPLPPGARRQDRGVRRLRPHRPGGGGPRPGVRGMRVMAIAGRPRPLEPAPDWGWAARASSRTCSRPRISS